MNTLLDLTLIVDLESIKLTMKLDVLTIKGFRGGCLINITDVHTFKIINKESYSTTISITTRPDCKLTVARRGDDYIKISHGVENKVKILTGEMETYVTNLKSSDKICITDQDEECEETDDDSYESDFINDDPIETDTDDDI